MLAENPDGSCFLVLDGIEHPVYDVHSVETVSSVSLPRVGERRLFFLEGALVCVFPDESPKTCNVNVYCSGDPFRSTMRLYSGKADSEFLNDIAAWLVFSDVSADFPYLI